MSGFVAALPMYDWPELRAGPDTQWAAIRDALQAAGIEAPERLARSNADLPPVPGGIRDKDGNVVASDPATLPPDEFDLPTLWRHPDLIFAQTCWGPMRETGLDRHVTVLGQPDYSDVEGGRGPLYSSAIVMRAGSLDGVDDAAPDDGRAVLPIVAMRGKRFVANEFHSMSGYLALGEDLAAIGEGYALFASTTLSGGHRASIRAVAEGQADVATIDCRSWSLAKRLEPAAAGLRVAGWTASRPGLPYIMSKRLEGRYSGTMQRALMEIAGAAVAKS